MSHEPSHGGKAAHGASKTSHHSKGPHGASAIHARKGGGGGKLLLGAVAAAVLLGGGYYAWSNYGPNSANVESAYNEPYADPYADTAPLDADDGLPAETASADEQPAAAPASTEPRTAARARRAAAPRTAEVPEETIGVTPIGVAAQDSEEIVVTAARRPTWAETPNPRRLSALYPERALERGREGEARLNCTVQAGGALDCVRESETPGGFGNAALRVARTYRHSTTLADGSDAVGTPVNLRVVFRLADERRGRG